MVETTAGRIHPAWTTALVALTTVVLAQALRTVFPAAYDLAEDWDKRLAGLVVVAALAAPVVTPLLRRVLGPRGSLGATIGALVVARALLQWYGAPTFTLALVAALLGLCALTLLLGAVRRDGPSGLGFTIGILVGIGADAAIRLAFGTWDLVWRRGTAQLGAQLVVAATLVALTAVLVILLRRGFACDGEPRRRAFVPAFLLGPALFLELVFLASPAFVASSGGRGLAAAGVVVLGTITVAVALAGPFARALASAISRVALGLLVGVGAFVLPDATGAWLVLLVVAMQLAVAGLLFAALGTAPSPERTPALHRTAGGLALGGLVMGLCTLGFQFHYEQPLPFTNRVFPALAGALLALAATVRTGAERSPIDAVARVARTATIGLATVTLAVPAWLVVTEPAYATAHGLPATVMTYNVHGGVSRAGQLDAEGLARDIERADADVVMIEETPRGWPVGGMLDFAEWAKRRLGYRYAWAPSADHQFGNLLLSRSPISDVQVVPLPREDSRMHRSAIVATLDTPSGTVHVVGAHTQDGTSPSRKAVRVLDMRILARLGTAHPRTIVLGDLNADPGSPELQLLLDAGLVTPMDTQQCTMQTSNDNCVDWILVSPDLRLTNVHVGGVNRSDHEPLVGTVSR